MITQFIIFEDSTHAQIFLVQADNEEQAWKLYLERQWNYVEQPDGTYRSKPVHHDNLDKAFGTYGIISHSDGSYSNTHGVAFPSLEEVKFKYSIEEQDNETFVSHNERYSSLEEAIPHIVGHRHVEIAPCNINLLIAFQTLFVSRDKRDYAQLDTKKEIEDDIISQHLWQAVRYESIGQVSGAVAELNKALKLTHDPRERLSISLDAGRLLESLNHLPAAAKQYKYALQVASEYDDHAAIRYGLASVYEKMGLTSKALWHYRRVPANHLDEEDSEELQKRIAELEKVSLPMKTD